MIDSDLLKKAIADAKALKLLVLSWHEKQFWGTCDWDNAKLGTIKRATCHCYYCDKQIPLETSSSHVETCRYPKKVSGYIRYDSEKRQSYETEIQPDGTEKICHWFPPDFCVELEKRIKEGRFGNIKKYRWG